MPTQNPAVVRRLVEAWRAAELEPKIGDRCQTALDRIQEISASQRAALDIANPFPGAVARGELGVGEAVEAQRTKPLSRADREEAQRIGSRGRTLVISDLTRDLRRQPVHEILAAAHDELIADATRLAPLVTGICDDTAAIASPPKVREAWARLTAHATRRKHILTARSRLLELGALPRRDDSAPPNASLFREPERIPPRTLNQPGARGLADLIESGSEPALVAAAELAERYPPARKNAERPAHMQPQL